ncbi:LytR/AlgR family response regulator transcription factor [Chryseobacterium sp. Leaf201]|uniref:LytR/AlgR family response regulator transcription factor n=1 Tax=Chryseobacterium sp. Leaf201 TaxID=1735672 RepID=UPI0006F78949|nr:LytTR family DNA-binding domain-containing protein [Chryseobacterium sp. Leaf201]KQM32209.1 LytTR family transcriptional regulator [Chryseobacterium sp. Leaf201]
MNKIKCLVVDDEPIAREIIESFIEKTPFLELIGSFGKSLDALNFIQNNKVDIILTDIEMPQLTGLQLINSLSQKPATIFITAYREYALEGFDTGVVDYLVKPVSYDRFLKAINRAKQSLNNQQENKIVLSQEKVDRIFIKADNKLVKILFEDIIYIEALKDYLRIHLSETERYITHSTMKAIEEKLPDNFFRIQRSFIINTKFAKSFYGNTVRMTIGENLPISLSAKAELFKKLGIENN